MSSYPNRASTGKLWQMNWSPNNVNWHPIGHIRNVTPSTEGRVLTEPSAGTRTTFKKIAQVQPQVRVTFDVQRLEYIIKNFIMNGNANVPLHYLLWYDGKAYYKFSGLGDSCSLRVSPGDSLQADCMIRGVAIRPASGIGWSGWSDDPLTHENVTLSVGSGWTNWERIDWGVENNVDQVSLGQNIIPSDVYDRQAEHAGSYRISRRWLGTKIPDSQSGISNAIQIVVTGALSGVTFSYPTSVIRRVTVEERDLDLIFEAGDWESEDVVIT